jgi:hypothetical protein
MRGRIFFRHSALFENRWSASVRQASSQPSFKGFGFGIVGHMINPDYPQACIRPNGDFPIDYEAGNFYATLCNQ